MKKIFTIMAIAAGVLAVSCGKNANPDDSSTKKDSTEDSGENPSGAPASLSGSAYFPIILDGVTAETIKSKILGDLRPNDGTNNLWVWDNTYNGGTASGFNFYGNAEGYTVLVVSGVADWSGAGYNVSAEAGVDMTPIATGDWYFHVAYKGASNVAQLLQLNYNGSQYNFVVGQGTFTDNGQTYSAILPVSGEFEANEWNEYEFSVKSTGMDFTKPFKADGDNVFVMLSGGNAGTEINLDAAFYYEK